MSVLLSLSKSSGVYKTLWIIYFRRLGDLHCLHCQQLTCKKKGMSLSHIHHINTVSTASRLTRYLQTKTLTKTARRMLPMSLKILKGSNSSASDPPSWAGFSLASWPRSFIASSNRDRYFWRPRRGEPLMSSDTRSPLGLCRIPMSSSSEPPCGSQMPGRGEPLLSGVALWERLLSPEASGRKGDGLGEEDEDHGSVLSRSRWKWGSVGRRVAPAADWRQV